MEEAIAAVARSMLSLEFGHESLNDDDASSAAEVSTTHASTTHASTAHGSTTHASKGMFFGAR